MSREPASAKVPVNIIFLVNLMNLNFVEMICSCCDFYKESDEGLECGAFKILKWLMENKKISPEDIDNAKNEIFRTER